MDGLLTAEYSPEWLCARKNACRSISKSANGFLCDIYNMTQAF